MDVGARSNTAGRGGAEKPRSSRLVATFAYGVSAGLFSVAVISTLQMQAAEDMRGRVMALYSICFLASSPVGGPTFGAIAGWVGVSSALRVEAFICAVVAVAAGIAWLAMRRFGRVV
jgi:hypothetical protein